MNAACPCCGQAMRAPPTDPVQFVAALGIGGKSSSRLLVHLAQNFGRYVSYENLIHALYWDDPNGGSLDPRNVETVLICMLKPRLIPLGLVIETAWGYGRRLTWAPA